jgi:hypothetical protein
VPLVLPPTPRIVRKKKKKKKNRPLPHAIHFLFLSIIFITFHFLATVIPFPTPDDRPRVRVVTAKDVLATLKPEEVKLKFSRKTFVPADSSRPFSRN